MLLYAILPLIVLVIDLPWLMITSDMVRKMIRNIQKTDLQVQIVPAIVVYVALAYLATLPKNPREAFLLGLCTYAVYDFTNLATLRNYTLEFAVMDSLWGGVLFTLLFFTINYFKKLNFRINS